MDTTMKLDGIAESVISSHSTRKYKATKPLRQYVTYHIHIWEPCLANSRDMQLQSSLNYPMDSNHLWMHLRVAWHTNEFEGTWDTWNRAGERLVIVSLKPTLQEVKFKVAAGHLKSCWRTFVNVSLKHTMQAARCKHCQWTLEIVMENVW